MITNYCVTVHSNENENIDFAHPSDELKKMVAEKFKEKIIGDWNSVVKVIVNGQHADYIIPMEIGA